MEVNPSILSLELILAILISFDDSILDEVFDEGNSSDDVGVLVTPIGKVILEALDLLLLLLKDLLLVRFHRLLLVDLGFGPSSLRGNFTQIGSVTFRCCYQKSRVKSVKSYKVDRDDLLLIAVEF